MTPLVEKRLAEAGVSPQVQNQLDLYSTKQKKQKKKIPPNLKKPGQSQNDAFLILSFFSKICCIIHPSHPSSVS